MKIKKPIMTIGLACLVLSSCSLFNKKEVNKEPRLPEKKVSRKLEKPKIKKDKTTEVLIDAEIKKEDIAKVVKHGDHWHVFTKDGREKITYTDPALLKDSDDFNLVSVVGKNKLKNKDVVSIKKHGDHWHVYLADGSEYLTYEDPSALFPHIRVGTYTGSHSSNRKTKTRRPNRTSQNDRVVKILKHGDHYHIYTASGKEYISYEDPSSMYPGIKIGIYQGNHGDNKKSEGNKNSPKKSEAKKEKPDSKKKDNKFDKIKDLNIAAVLGQGEVDRYDIVKILRHGDHWHIYDSRGNEGIVYEDPSSLYPKASVGEYEGSHGQKNQGKKESPQKEPPKKDKKQDDSKKTHNVVKILRHGDHWHIYTADGKEYISYEDPSARYPDVEVGIYEGSHGKTDEEKPQKEDPKEEKPEKEDSRKEHPKKESPKKEPPKEDSNKKEENRLEKIKNLKITGILGQDEVDRFDIVKILKHEDHYHIYDSKGNEGIVYENPMDLYPKASFGHYEGSHGKKDSEEEKKWPEGITKIVDHGDHWHLYRGDKEVAIVRENPKAHYPDAEYIKEGSDHSDIEVGKDEIFSFDSVRAEKAYGIESVLTNNIRAMEGFGKIKDGRPVFGTEDKDGNVFYWLHGDHYHALSIKDLVRMEKAGEFGDYTAKEVVAALKYKLQNPDEDLEYRPSLDIYEVVDYLKSYYGIKDSSRILNIGLDTIYIYTNDDSVSFHISDFEKKDGAIAYKKGELPKILSDKELEDLEKKDSEKDQEDIKADEPEKSKEKPEKEVKPEDKEDTEDLGKDDSKKEEVDQEESEVKKDKDPKDETQSPKKTSENPGKEAEKPANKNEPTDEAQKKSTSKEEKQAQPKLEE